MNNPIGYYCDTGTPVIRDFEQQYGSRLEKLEFTEKIFLIVNLSEDLTILEEEEYSNEIRAYVGRFSREVMDQGDAIALIKALADSL